MSADFIKGSDYRANQIHFDELLQEAQREHLIRSALADQEQCHCLRYRIFDRIRQSLVSVGSQLQTRFGTGMEITIHIPEAESHRC